MRGVRRGPRPSTAAALAASLLAHGLLLASMLVAGPARPPTETPPVSVELVALMDEPAMPGAESALSAPPQPDLAAAPPLSEAIPAPPVSADSGPAPAEAVPPLPTALASAELPPVADLPAPEPAPAQAVAPPLKRLRPSERPTRRRPEPWQQAAVPAMAAAPVPIPDSQATTAASVAHQAPAPVDPSWQRALAVWIAAHKRYPERAREDGQQGAVNVAFTVLRDGRVQDVRIARSSGLPVLDRSVEDMLVNERVPPFPALMPEAQTEVRVTIRFELLR